MMRVRVGWYASATICIIVIVARRWWDTHERRTSAEIEDFLGIMNFGETEGHRPHSTSHHHRPDTSTLHTSPLRSQSAGAISRLQFCGLQIFHHIETPILISFSSA